MIRPTQTRLLVAILLSLSAQVAPAQSPLFGALHAGDSKQLAKLLKDQPDVDARDRYRATPLMYAAAYGTLNDVRLLVEAGASVNASSEQGFTPLMFSTGEVDKLTFLLKAGAKVNVSTKSGATALLCAALRGNLEGVRVLLDAGADTTGRMSIFPNAPVQVDLLQIAWTSNNPGLRNLLSSRGLKPSLPALQGPPGSVPMSGLFVLSGFSMRPGVVPGVRDGVDALLALGADPNAEVRQLARSLPPVSLAGMFSDTAAIRSLLEKGADPNRPGTQGITPLMMAAAGEDASPESIKLILDRGARIDTRDALGRTALDWALFQGESPVSALLRQRGATVGGWKAPEPEAVAAPRGGREAVELALNKLQTSAVEFHRQAKCISCHHQSLTAVAASIARKNGIPMANDLSAHPTTASLGMWAPSRENFLAGNCGVFGFLGNVSYGLFGMAAEEVRPNDITDAATLCLSSLQLPDGHWEGGDMRPPLAGRLPILYTALGISALKTYMPPAARAKAKVQIAKALQYLRTAVPSDTQGESFRLIGLVLGGASRAEITQQANRVRRLQQADGGWAQRESMRPDAYATGQALYALHLSGSRVSDPAFQRGTGFLLRTQGKEGTWFVPSRTLGFQPYLETGFPYGRDQFLSAAGTAWATIALALQTGQARPDGRAQRLPKTSSPAAALAVRPRGSTQTPQ